MDGPSVLADFPPSGSLLQRQHPAAPSFWPAKEISEARRKYRASKEVNVRGSMEEALGDVGLEECAIALRVIEAFTRVPEEFSPGTTEHAARKQLRDACLRWLKPGKVANRKEVTAVRTFEDSQTIEARSIYSP